MQLNGRLNVKSMFRRRLVRDEPCDPCPPALAVFPTTSEEECYPIGVETIVRAHLDGEDLTESASALADQYVRDGNSLAKLLSHLDGCVREAGAGDLTADMVKTVGLAWSERVLYQLGSVGCVDPLTGLSSIQHVKSRLTDLYRASVPGGLSNNEEARGALLVVELATPEAIGQAGARIRLLSQKRDESAMYLTVHGALDGAEVVGSLNGNVCVVVFGHGELRDIDASWLKTRIDGEFALDPDYFGSQVWVEQLPAKLDEAFQLIDDLARQGTE